MGEQDNISNEIRKAELRRLLHAYEYKRIEAREKAMVPKDPFNIYHFAQQLAYEESIKLLLEAFGEEMGVNYE